MEFCELGDLSYFIKKRDTLSRHNTTADMIRKYPNPPAGGLNEVIVRHFLKQLASALEFLRDRNFIHRDIKPQNLLLDPSPLYYAKAKPETIPYAAHEQSLIPLAGVESLPTLKIADFGFARSLPSTSLAETLCGSPLYMAPEILRYEKYDAKADLWSVGTVLHEMMVGKPPFRASNHVELLRKIERGEDRIRFPEDVCLSDAMKKIIRGLLKRNPVERMSFADFFNNIVIRGEIPGLVGEDKVAELPKEAEISAPEPSSPRDKPSEDGHPLGMERPNISETEKALSKSPRHALLHGPQTTAAKAEPTLHRRSSGTPPRTPAPQPQSNHDRAASNQIPKESGTQPRRPSFPSHTTAPARQEFVTGMRAAAGTSMQKQPIRNTPSPNTTIPTEKLQSRERVPQRREDKAAKEARELRERAAQDVAFERDYVVVEKRAVEVNAFADELAASPRIHGAPQTQQDAHRGAMVRRATTQGAPNSTTGAHVTPSRAIQLASGKRPDQTHHRQASYERRIRDPTSATSAISKAINMASGRLFNMGFSPPLGLGRGGVSPPSYSPFPAYPANASLMIGNGGKGTAPLDEDARAVHVIEESATRSDVVYGFAEVKYKQLIPLAPSMEHGLGLRQAGIPEGAEDDNSTTEDDGLTVDAIVTLSEEALVLYVKALSLLARSMDIAGAWWARKNRGEIIEESSSPRTPTNALGGVNGPTGNRVNNVVQWVRSRFNEVLEKAEFVRLKLMEAQKQLPIDHPSHPSHHQPISSSTAGMGTSADNIVVTTGVTAEKLMYDRALEMSRSAAVNELVGDDLPGCEIAYITAIRMLEAVLEDDEDPPPKKSSQTDKDPEDSAINGVEAEDRKVVLKCKHPYSPNTWTIFTNETVVVHSIRTRLAALQKKMQIISKRTSIPQAPGPPAKPTSVTLNPAVAGTTPQ